MAELDGSLSKLSYAAFWVIPYHARSRSSVPVTRIVHLTDEELDYFTENADDSDMDHTLHTDINFTALKIH